MRAKGLDRMTRRLMPVIVCGALLATPVAFAVELSHTQVTETGSKDSPAAASALADTDLARARVWGLSETEWHRYRHLMQGIRGSVSPSTISPLEVLGIHARDDEERQRYAEAWVRAMREDVDRILAFQRAYDAAGKRLYPNEPLKSYGKNSICTIDALLDELENVRQNGYAVDDEEFCEGIRCVAAPIRVD